jgi:CRP-like cAMP-binding protein
MMEGMPDMEPRRPVLGEAKLETRACLDAGDYPRALALTDHLLATFPLDDQLRVLTAEILARAGLTDEAEELTRALAQHFIQIGQPLRAVVAAHTLAQMGRPAHGPGILGEVARTYAQGSPRLAPFTARPAPPDPDAPVPPGSSDGLPPFDELALRAHRRAIDLSAHGAYQPNLHRVPFLSELIEAHLLAVLASMRLHRLRPGDLMMRQGEPGSSIYLIASGELRVFVRHPGAPDKELARVHGNSLVGEMALLTSQPRAANVMVVREADVLEITREALDQLAVRIPALKVSLDRFARERLIKNLLATSPLFAPFTKDQQAELLRRFEGMEVEPGVEIIREGDQGRGLFVVLSGELEVFTRDPATRAQVQLGQLHTGDIFGEMSLLNQLPTSATVRSLNRCNLLFLARVYVDRLSAAFPEVRTYFAEVAARRARDNNLRLGASLPEEPVEELDISDVLLI